ncbi:MAG: hypothetical protein IJG40_16625 [Oscillospiraceae bacterium]|nr:hypothetical protein [Oscillospiraceae bacterium]
MTYGELKMRVLELIFSYSVAGSPIPATYNNQADYIAMIPGLVNNGQTDIATSVKRIPAMAFLIDLEQEEVGNRVLYKLPSDCWLPFTGGLLFPESRSYERYFGYRFIGGRIELPFHAPSGLALEYWRYPETVSSGTPDSEELDNAPDVHECLVFYVAAHLLAYDDAYRYTVFLNMYEERRKRLREPVWIEPCPIEDVYRRGR